MSILDEVNVQLSDLRQRVSVLERDLEDRNELWTTICNTLRVVFYIGWFIGTIGLLIFYLNA